MLALEESKKHLDWNIFSLGSSIHRQGSHLLALRRTEGWQSRMAARYGGHWYGHLSTHSSRKEGHHEPTTQVSGEGSGR